MRRLSRYEPTEEQLRCFQESLAKLEDGALWAWTESGHLFRVNQEIKSVALLEGAQNNWYWMAKKCLNKLGYALHDNKPSI